MATKMEGVDVLAIQMKAHRVRVGDHWHPGALVRDEKPVEIAAGGPISQYCWQLHKNNNSRI